MTFFFAHIGYFYIAIYLITALYCVIAQNQTAFISAVFLGFLAVQGWTDLWYNPDDMSIFHAGLITLMGFPMKGRHGMRLIYIVFVMLLADCLWMLLPEINLTRNAWSFPYSLFYWQSTLNILFLAACITTLKGAYNTRLISKYQARVEHDKFMAFESDKIRT